MGKITIIASRPGVGKSTYAYKLFQNLNSFGKRGIYVSLEQEKDSYGYNVV